MKTLTGLIKNLAIYKYSSLAFPQGNVGSWQKTLVINQNLRFKAKQLDMFAIPSHPKIVAKGYNFIEIDSDLPVLQLAFTKRQNQQEDYERTEKIQFLFTFKQLSTLLDIQPNSGAQVCIEFPERKGNKWTYKFKDIKQSQEIRFEYHELNVITRGQANFQAYVEYSQFEVFQDIIKQSLLDLSGLRFMFEVSRQQKVEMIKKDIRLIKERENEIKSFYS